MIVGMHETIKNANGDNESLDPVLLRQKYPRVQMVREFTGNVLKPQRLTTKMMRECTQAIQSGLIVVWSFKPSAADVASGAWDVHLRELAKYIFDNALAGNVWVCIWHEPENDMRASDFVKMFNRVHDVLKSVHTGIVTVHAALGYRYREGGEITNPADWKTKADVKAIDIYSGETFPLATILPELTAFKRWHAGLVSDGAWAVTERGWSASASVDNEQALRAATIRREAEWLRDSGIGQRCIAYILWDSSGTEDNADLKFDTGTEIAARWLMDVLTGINPSPQPQQHTVTCPLCKGKGKYTFTVEGTTNGAED